MRLSYEPYTIKLKNIWRIAHGVSVERHNVFVRIGEGWGEAAGVPQHGESQAGIMAYLDQLADREWDPYDLEEPLRNLPAGSDAAKCALDLALCDNLAKQLNVPLYRLLGLDPAKAPLTTFTISIDKPEVMAERAKESGMPLIKIKLGGDEDDLEIVRQVRAATNARLRVDANAGWSREKALHLIPRLVDYGIEFVEQPLAIGDIEGLRWLRQQNCGLPIFADENIKSSHDIAAHAGAVDGVVVKLAKTGGIREALRAIHTARALDMQVMIGCMVETSLAVAAAAHLSPLCDYADLDGPMLIANDPFSGLSYEGAKIILNETPGFGLIRLG